MDPLQESFNHHKQLKQEFVSNLTGSSMLEIAALSTIVPALIVLRHSLGFNDFLNTIGNSSKKNDGAPIGCRYWRVYVITLAIDFSFIVLPILLCFTVLAEWSHIFAICLIMLLALCILAKRFGSSSSESAGGQWPIDSVGTTISSYRVSMMIVTCLCILAVDFKIFPRRYAKTETFGTGLMDLGVGSFVLANSLISRQARNLFSMKWKTAILSSTPLVILGVGRVIFTAGVNYQVHVGEYGVHWNFFFTLAAVSILTSIINIHPQYCGFLGLSILAGYQTSLMSGLNDYLLSDERTVSIISQNKEGIFSIFGYWGMYLVGVLLGNYLFFRSDSSSKTRSKQWTRVKIWILSVMFWLLTIILDKHVEKVSRRMCNLAYVAFVLAQNFQVLAILTLGDLIPGQKTSALEEAFNLNLLAVFLLANVLTGLINLTVNTISTSSITALAILVGYAFVLSVLAGFAKILGIKLKFW
ncbi:hypothetical protein GIB67_033476 [Kingdonia uniflora]|uniref:GPI-anchored wall transfer protein n=1 Tax=Kingdonia uniflora TaxID=39325 RepID=A0A7J7LMM0_9MAGN|nr:hypothetical protein GIB67_033476 [Kingdonia uniflora]